MGTLGESGASDDVPGLLGGVGTLGESGASTALPSLSGLGLLTRAFFFWGSCLFAAKSWLLFVASFCMRLIFGADAAGLSKPLLAWSLL